MDKINIQNLNLDYLKKNHTKIDWDIISEHKCFHNKTEELFELRNFINWDLLCKHRYNCFMDDFFYIFPDQINWYEPNIYIKMSVDIIIDLKLKIKRWDIVSKIFIFSENNLLLLADYLVWDTIFKTHKLSENFIIELIKLTPKNLYQSTIIENVKCSENLLEIMFWYFDSFAEDDYYYDYHIWKLISIYQNITPEFAIKYYHQIDWKVFFKYQSKLPFLQEKYLKYEKINNQIYKDYQKCIFLKNKIVDFLYKPEGNMYLKTKQHFYQLSF